MTTFRGRRLDAPIGAMAEPWDQTGVHGALGHDRPPPEIDVAPIPWVSRLTPDPWVDNGDGTRSWQPFGPVSPAELDAHLRLLKELAERPF
jgi:hypothetical protein